MRFIGTNLVAAAALVLGVGSAVAAPAQIITTHAFAHGLDMQSGRSSVVDGADGINDKYRFSAGFNSSSPCETSRIDTLFCRDQH